MSTPMTFAELQTAIDAAANTTDANTIEVAKAASDHYRALTEIQRRCAYLSFSSSMLVEGA